MICNMQLYNYWDVLYSRIPMPSGMATYWGVSNLTIIDNGLSYGRHKAII